MGRRKDFYNNTHCGHSSKSFIVSAARVLLVVVVVLILTKTSTSTAGFSNVTTMEFDEGYTQLFGDQNLVRFSNGRGVKLILDIYTGSGFKSTDAYYHGLFSASIKLPTAAYTAGVVVAFYVSNGDIFKRTHDEIDFEFLGNIKGKPWKVQTNVYGSGSTRRGREERYILPFDPSQAAHRYSILWSKTSIIFYVDDTPIREVVRSREMGGEFPSKPMSVYATIWDGSSWATSGGSHKVNYKNSPFLAEFSNLVLKGCPVDPVEEVLSPESMADWCDGLGVEEDRSTVEYSIMTPTKRQAMQSFRKKHLIYSVCYDMLRYPTPFPDCDLASMESEKIRFLDSGHIRRRSRKRYGGGRVTKVFDTTDY